MASPKRLLSPGEVVVKQFRPHWQVLIVPALALLVAIVFAIAQLDGVVALLVSVGAIAVWALLSAARPARWFTTIITDERVIYRAGVLARSGVEIPLESVTNVSFGQSVWERMLRSGDLIIESAGETGQSRYFDIPDPEGLQSLIYQQREARTLDLGRGSSTLVGEFEGLACLRDQGELSQEDFQRQKRRLLDS